MTKIELANLASDAARKAGKKIMEVYTADDIETELKDDNSPLTLADRRAQAEIQSILEVSDLPILSEEGREIPYEERKEWKSFWLVDPLDGTKEFINKNDEFTVNIALIENGKASIGVIYVPASDKLYVGIDKLGAYVEDKNGKKELLEKSTPIDLEELKKMQGINVVASKSHLDSETQNFIESLIDAKNISMGSSLKFISIAEGEAQVYPRFAPTMEWDTAAAQGILESLGYHVYTYPDLEVLRYNREVLVNPHFIAF